MEGKIKRLLGIDSKEVTERIKCCSVCEKITYYTTMEWMSFLAAHGIQIITSWGDLTTIPEMEKREPMLNKQSYCMICKCPIQDKAFSKNETCPLGKWEEL